jgi:spoIIIJ-associated protein
MSQEKTTLEVIAPTVEEAVQRGIAQLNLPQDAVTVEVLDAGSRGLFGLGSRQARVRLTVKIHPAVDGPVAQGTRPQHEVVTVAGQVSEKKSQSQPEQVPSASPVDEEFVQATQSTQDETLDTAIEVVSSLLDRMKVRARVSASYHSPEDDSDEQVVLVDVEGNDLSILIGRHSETLNALQYVSSLIVCKQLDRWVPVTIDIQGYRARRERQLRQIARRMAEQAIHTGRRQVLEPMPANERRLIHLELRDHAEVDTESVGEEPNRKVTIFPKK